MKKLYILIILSNLILTFSSQAQPTFSQVSSTCSGTFTISDPDGAVNGANELINNQFLLASDNTFQFEINVPGASEIILTYETSDIFKNGDDLLIYTNSIDPDSLIHDWDGIIDPTTSDTTIIPSGKAILFYTNGIYSANKQSYLTLYWQANGSLETDGLATDVTCFGANNGTAQVFPNSSSTTFTYVWDTALNTRKITGLPPRNYTVNVTDGNSCNFDTTFTISQPPTLDATVSIASNNCDPSGTTGSLAITPSGGTTPYTYNWAGSLSTNDTLNNLDAGAYNFTVTDANGCTKTGSGSVTEPTNTLTYSVTFSSNVTCNGDNNGSITIAGNDGNGPYTFLWGPEAGNATTATVNNLVAGTYNFTVTDALNCKSIGNQVITEPLEMVVELVSKTNASYYGATNGTINITVLNVLGTPSYNWSGPTTPALSDSISGLSAGTYNLTVTDNPCGSEVYATYTITQPTAVYAGTIDIGGESSALICKGETPAVIASTTTADGPSGIDSYSWRFSPDNSTWSDSLIDNASYTFANPITKHYYIKRLAHVGVTSFESNTVFLQLSNLSTTKEVINNVLCNSGNTGKARVIASGGTAPYNYAFSGGTITDSLIEDLTATNYAYTVTDADLCESTGTIVINQPSAALTIDTTSSRTLFNGYLVSCNGSNDGWIEVAPTGGTAPYTYAWNNNADLNSGTQITAKAINLSIDTYECTVTDAQGCAINTGSLTFTAPTAVSVTPVATAAVCAGQENGTITAIGTGGVGVLQYQWTDSMGYDINKNIRPGLFAGSYTVSVQDANGCVASTSQAVNEPTPVVITFVDSTDYNGYGIECNSGNNGEIEISASGGTVATVYTYTWTGTAQTTPSITGLSAGNYSVTVEDDNGCSALSAIFKLTAPELITQIFIDSSNYNNWGISCNLGNTGFIEVVGEGGSGSYSYSWTDGQSTAKATALVAGDYTVTVSDNLNTCPTSIQTYTITNPPALGYTFVDTTNHNGNGWAVSCNGANDGEIEINGSGGVTPYFIQWDTNTGNQTGITAINLTANAYSFTITDANNCSTPFANEITIHEPPVFDIALNTNTPCSNYGDNDGALEISAINGVGIPSYLWTGDILVNTDQDQYNLIAGFYSVTATDENFCSTNKTYQVTQPADLIGGSIQINLSDKDTICQGLKPMPFVNISIPTQGSFPYNYAWESSFNNVDWDTIPASTNTIAFTWDSVIDKDYYIRRKVKDVSGDSAYSNTLFLDFTPAPTLSISNLASEYCKNANNVTIIGSPTNSNGTFIAPWGTITTTNGIAQFSPDVDTNAYPNPITFTYEYDQNGCISSTSQNTIIRPLPAPTFTIPDTVKSNIPEVAITAISPPNGLFTGKGVISSAQLIQTQYLTLNVAEKIIYKAENSYGCSDTTSRYITKVEESGSIVDNNNVSNTNLYFCIDGGTIVLKAIVVGATVGYFKTTGGVIDDGNKETGKINPLTNGAGVFTAEFYYETGGVGSTITEQFTIFDVSSKAQIADLEAKYCKYGQEVIIHSIPSSEGSGVFSGPTGVSPYAKDSARLTINSMSTTSTSSPHAINYLYTHTTSGCVYNRIGYVNIYGLPTVSFNIKDTFNVTESQKPFTDIVPSMATNFSGTGVVGTSFNPQGLQTGNYQVTLSYTNITTGCLNTYPKTVTVDTARGSFIGLPTNNIYCGNGLPDTIVYQPNGNIYNPISYTIDTLVVATGTDTIIIVPDTLASGSHILKYSYLGADNITEFTITKNFEIDDLGTPSIDVIKTDFCNYDGEVILTGKINSNLTNRGLFVGEALIPDLTNDGKATFLPMSANIGATPIVYTYSSTNTNSTCQVFDTINLTVHSRPSLSFELQAIYDFNGENDTLTANAIGGSYSPSNYFVKDNVFDPSLAGVGTWPITYNYTDEFGCFNSLSKNAKVEQPTGSIANFKAYYCYDEGELTLNYTGLTNSSGAFGQFSGLGITDNGDNSASFDPKYTYDNDTTIKIDSMVTVDITFIYLGTDNTTIFTKTQTTKVRNNGEITITNLNDSTGYCANTESVTLSATPTKGIFSGNGITGNIFNPGNVSDTATLITYTFTDSKSGCITSKSDTIAILEVPSITFLLDEQTCSNSTSDTIVGYPRGGKISSTASIVQLAGNADSVKFTPNADFIGVNTVTYTYTNPANGCTNSLTKPITIDTIPNVAIELPMPEKGFCFVNNAFLIEGFANGINAFKGTFTGKGIVNPTQNTGKGLYNPILVNAASENITENVIFTYTDDNGCTNTALFAAKVNTLPKPSINNGQLNDTAFCGNNTNNITLNGSYLNGEVSFIIENQTFYSSSIPFKPSNYADKDSVNITFYNKDDNGCENSTTDYLKILDVPSRTFEMSNICIADPIPFKYLGATPPNQIDSIFWDFGDDSTSNTLNPTHKYLVEEQVKIRFFIEGTNGCFTDTISAAINLESNPNADFTWKYECITDPAVEFSASSQEITYLHTWNFGDGSPENSDTNPTKKYNDVGEYQITHSIESDNDNSSCKSVVSKTLFIRPTYTITRQNDYTESFENGHGYWIPEKLNAGSNSFTWQYGIPEAPIINSAPDGLNVYATNLKGAYNPNENSALTSPCFNFDSVDRPMISLNLFRHMENGLDGVVFEYTTDAGENWRLVGEVNEGINWYNSQNIRSRPGSLSNVGWTDFSSEWTDSRFDLDSVKNTQAEDKTVRFRIAFASTDYAEVFEGFAFDNLRIGERTRKVLIEHFTNTENSNTSNKEINDLINQVPTDAIDIQYHTSINTNDQFYKDYPLGSSSREAYYGVNSVPYTYFDGTVKFDFVGTNTPEKSTLKSQALLDPSFKMNLETIKNASGMVINLSVKALEEITDRQLQLQVAIVEKAVTLSSGILVYENVLRRFLPNPGGTYISTNWELGKTENYSFEYLINNYVVNKDTLIVVAFIQDEVTKEILQTVTNDASSISTSIKPWLTQGDDLDFIIYPNPTNNIAYFAFGKATSQNSSLQIINLNGKVIDVIGIAEKSNSTYYDFSSLKEGLYYIRWLNQHQQKIKKLMVIH